MEETGAFYSCLCIGDADLLGGAIERGLVAGAVRASEIGERGPPIAKAVSDATKALEQLDAETRAGPLVLSRTFDEPLPMNDDLVDRGTFVFVGAPAGEATGAAAFLIRPAAEEREAMARRSLEVAERVAELAESLKAKVKLSG